jgi:hypothetical protein
LGHRIDEQIGTTKVTAYRISPTVVLARSQWMKVHTVIDRGIRRIETGKGLMMQETLFISVLSPLVLKVDLANGTTVNTPKRQTNPICYHRPRNAVTRTAFFLTGRPGRPILIIVAKLVHSTLNARSQIGTNRAEAEPLVPLPIPTPTPSVSVCANSPRQAKKPRLPEHPSHSVLIASDPMLNQQRK